MRISKKSRRDTKKKSELHRLRRKLGMFAESLVTELYLNDDAQNLPLCAINSEQILDRFIVEEFGHSNTTISTLLEDKMGGVIRKSINSARAAGVPLVPVTYDYFDLSEEDVEMMIEAEDAKPYVAGQGGSGSKSWGCRYICDNSEADPFFGVWYSQMVKSTNGMTGVVQDMATGAKDANLVGFNPRSNLVRKTLGQAPLELPK